MEVVTKILYEHQLMQTSNELLLDILLVSKKGLCHMTLEGSKPVLWVNQFKLMQQGAFFPQKKNKNKIASH